MASVACSHHGRLKARARDTVEVGLNIGESFSYMGRGAVYLMMSKLSTLDADVCFTLEGRADDELPELILGAGRWRAWSRPSRRPDLRGPAPRSPRWPRCAR